MKNAGNSRPLSVIFAGCLFCILWSCGYTVSASAETAEHEIDGRRVVRGSELYDSMDEMPEPAAEFEDETGKLYDLLTWKAETVPVTERWETVDGEILYRSVMRDDEVPGGAEFQVKDEVSGKTAAAELPLTETEYENERWDEEFSFTATFHQYGADRYYLGEREIRSLEHEEPAPYSGELLALIGLEPESCRLERWEWAGEPYTDETGILCRDAAVYGKIRVYDCRAVYRGQTKLPDYERFRMLAVYEPRKTKEPEETAAALHASETESHAADTGADAARGTKNGFWETVIRVAKKCLKLTLGLFLIGLVIFGLRVLIRAAGKLDRRWKDMDERRK